MQSAKCRGTQRLQDLEQQARFLVDAEKNACCEQREAAGKALLAKAEELQAKELQIRELETEQRQEAAAVEAKAEQLRKLEAETRENANALEVRQREVEAFRQLYLEQQRQVKERASELKRQVKAKMDELHRKDQELERTAKAQAARTEKAKAELSAQRRLLEERARQEEAKQKTLEEERARVNAEAALVRKAQEEQRFHMKHRKSQWESRDDGTGGYGTSRQSDSRGSWGGSQGQRH